MLPEALDELEAAYGLAKGKAAAKSKTPSARGAARAKV